MKLESCLLNLSTQDLRAILAFYHLSPTQDMNRPVLISTILAHLGSPATFRAVFESFSPQEIEILLSLRAESGAVATTQLQNAYGGDDVDSLIRWSWGRDLPEGIPSLRLKGILYRIIPVVDIIENGMYVIPDEFLDSIDNIRIPSTEIHDARIPFYSDVSDTLCLQHMFEMLRYIDSCKLRPLRDGSLSLRHQNSIIELLARIHPQILSRDMHSYVSFLYTIAVALGLIRTINNRSRLDRSSTDWFNRSPQSQLLDMFHAWLNHGTYDDFYKISGIKVISGGLRQTSLQVRKIVVDAFKHTDLTTWIDKDKFIKHFEQNQPRFFRPFYDDHHWIVEYKNGDEIWTTKTKPFLIEYAFLNFIICGPLFWLGLVQLGKNDNNVTSFMLSREGRHILRGESFAETAAMGIACNQIIVQPDFEILVSENAVLSVRFMVDRISEPIGIGPISHYRLTRNSIARAMESGLEINDIIGFLEATSSVGLSQNVRASIESWKSHYGRVRIGAMYYLETKDHFIMKELQTHTRMSNLLGDSIGLVTNRISADNLVPMITELKRCGYLPKVDPALILDSTETPHPIYLSETLIPSLKRLLATVLQKKPAWLTDRMIEDIERIMYSIERTTSETLSESYSEEENH